MDILFYMLSSDKIGTTGTHIFEVLNNLSNMGHSIRYMNGKKYSPITAREFDLRRGQNPRWSLWGQIKIFMAATPLRGGALVLWKFLKEIRLFFSALGTVLLRRPDVIYRRHTLFNSDYLITKLFNIHSVREVNGIVVDEIKVTKRSDNITLRVINWIERFTMPKADEIIVVTPKMKELLHSEYGVDLNKITVIQNGANTDLFKPMNAITVRETLDLAQDVNYACFVGSLNKLQGLEYLVQSLPLILDQCPNTQILIVGDGSIKEQLYKLAKKTGVSNKIIFTGMVHYQEVPRYINASDICVAPMVKERNQRIGLSPLKLCEYLACGKPVVASRISGLEILEKYNCGYLINPESPEELAQAIIKLLRDPILRQNMGENGRKYVLENRSWESVAKKVSATFENIVKVLDLPPPN